MNQIERLRQAHDGKLPASAWPGCYPLLYVCRDGSVVCPECANREVDYAQEVVNYDAHYEGSPAICGDCGQAIESAYQEH